jgi:uncharacterized membrane protein
MATPAWALTIAYWLHMLATVAWIGGLAALSLFVLPAAHKTLEAPAYAAFLAAMQRRLDPLAWFSLAILAGTGMLQMSASPHYQGFLAIENPWAAAILVKHFLFLAMACISAYITWGLLPALRRLALRRLKALETPPDAETERLQRREALLLRLNLILGALALLLTAFARAA